MVAHATILPVLVLFAAAASGQVCSPGKYKNFGQCKDCHYWQYGDVCADSRNGCKYSDCKVCGMPALITLIK
jgi:hypothetical protein